LMGYNDATKIQSTRYIKWVKSNEWKNRKDNDN